MSPLKLLVNSKFLINQTVINTICIKLYAFKETNIERVTTLMDILMQTMKYTQRCQYSYNIIGIFSIITTDMA